jgi:hypothetical protein
MLYLDIFDTTVALQPTCYKRTMFVSPVVVEFFFRQFWVAFCTDGNAYELICGHGEIWLTK